MVNHYFLFDLAVMIFLVIAVKLLLRDGERSSPITQEDDAAADKHQQCDMIHIANTTSSSVDKPETQRTTHQDTSNDDVDSSHLQVGGIVELYGRKSNFATPARITGYKKEKSSVKYNLVNDFTDTHTSGVAPEFIHPYQDYEEGTQAYCNVGALHEIYMTHCTIVSHSIKKSGIISYQVSYLNEENELIPQHLPFSRILRIRSEAMG